METYVAKSPSSACAVVRVLAARAPAVEVKAAPAHAVFGDDAAPYAAAPCAKLAAKVVVVRALRAEAEAYPDQVAAARVGRAPVGASRARTALQDRIDCGYEVGSQSH